MNAIRQIVKVKNHSLNITLPADFDAELAEVIIFPKDKNDFEISEKEMELIRNRIKKTNPENLKSWRELRKDYL